MGREARSSSGASCGGGGGGGKSNGHGGWGLKYVKSHEVWILAR